MKRLAALLACAALASPAPADEPKDTFKKIEKGTGQLLDSMGREIKKISGPAGKKDDKKAEKPKEPAK